LKSFAQPMIGKKETALFAPVFTPGLGQKELVDDYGLKASMQYLNDVGTDGSETLQQLYEHYPAEMLDEMVAVIRKHNPAATDAQM
jgi:hypothetical protein